MSQIVCVLVLEQRRIANIEIKGSSFPLLFEGML